MDKTKIIYRISDTGYSKQKPTYVNNEQCLKNAVSRFSLDTCDWKIIADNTSPATNEMILKYLPNNCIEYVNLKNGAATFNLGLDIALNYKDSDIVYFIENDYLHKENSLVVLKEGLGLGADFITLYDHPDKYIDGINPYVIDGGEHTKVFLSNSCHWKLTNSTTMTFASTILTLKQLESIIRQYTSTTHPYDFEMWIDLRNQGASLISPIPGYSTHCESLWLTPLINWEKEAI
jgi:hypothetical protein